MEVVVVVTVAVLYVGGRYLYRIWEEYWRGPKAVTDSTLFDVLFELHVRSEFSSQSGLSCLKAGVKTALRPPATRRAAVLLLLHPAEARLTARRLAARLLRVCLAATGRPRAEGWVERHLALSGRQFAGLGDFWQFHLELKLRLDEHDMALVEDFHKVHPHAATLVTGFVHDIFRPGSKTVLVLLMKTAWSETPDKTSPDGAAHSALQRYFGHSLDEGSMDDLLRVVAERPVFVLPALSLTQ